MNRRKFLQQTITMTGAMSVADVTRVTSQSLARGTKPKQSGKDRPNVLFIMTDQQRYDCVGANGNPIIKTPNLDALVKKSANFSNVFVQSPVCTPSRACFFTGRYAHAHRNRVNYTELDEKEILLPKYLQDIGYQTTLIGKTHLYYKYPPTPEEAKRTGYTFVELHDGVHSTDPFSDYVKWREKNDPDKEIYYRELAQNVPEKKANMLPGDNPNRAAINKDYTDTAWVGLKTREYLERFCQANEPFFLFSSFWKPHSPYEVPIPYDSMYNDVEIPLPEKNKRENITSLPEPVKKLILRNEYRGRKANINLPDEELQWLYRSYYGTVSHIDDEVGLILKTLEETGLAENTIVIFTSDHGDQLLEHGVHGKNVFFESSVHVPLMISFPKHIHPGEYDNLVMSIDVLPTLFEMLGLEKPYHCHGHSLVPLIDGKNRPYKAREYVFSENVMPEVFANVFNYEKGRGVMGVTHPDGKMVRTKRWKYNYYGTGESELYDLKNDPNEKTNLAQDPQYKNIANEMKGHILDWLLTATETEQIAPRWLI